MVNRNVLLFSSWLLSYGSYSCTENRGCDQGNKLFRLVCSHLNEKNECTTSIDQLESVSEEMKSLECDSFINDLIKLRYAQYLCSSFDVQNGLESKVDIDDKDRVTMDYIKGLELYSQLLFSRMKKTVKESGDFSKYLRKLKIDDKYFEHHIDELINILFQDKNLIEEDMKKISPSKAFVPYNLSWLNLDRSSLLIPDKPSGIYFNPLEPITKLKNLDEMSNYIINYMYDKLKKLNSNDILDGFLWFQDDLKSKIDVEKYFKRIEQLYKSDKNPSDYMIFLNSLNNYLSYLNLPHRPLKDKLSFYISKAKATCLNENKYLLDRMNNGISFKNKYIEYLFYSTLGKNYYFLHDYKKAASYYNHSLNYKFKMKRQLELSKSYFHLENYGKALETFKKAKDYSKLTKEDKKNLKRENQYYISLLEITHHNEEHDQVLSVYNQEIFENRSKNNSEFRKQVKKAYNLMVQNEKNRLEQEANQKKVLISKSQTKEQIKQETEYSFIGPTLGNQKKNYISASSKKKKTRGNAVHVPALVAPPIIPIEPPVIHVEDIIENNPLKVFNRLFGPYESSPIMDQHIKLHPDEIETLFKALKLPFSRSKGKGDRMKATLLSTNNENEPIEEMIIIPYRTNIGPSYIRTLRESFIKTMGLYPAYLKEILQDKELIK